MGFPPLRTAGRAAATRIGPKTCLRHGATLADEWNAQAAPRQSPRRRHPGPLQAFCGVAAAALILSLGAGVLLRNHDAATLVTAAVPPPTADRAASWIEVKRPFQMFDIAGGPFARLPLQVTARRNEVGTARQQTLTYGAPSPGERFLRITLDRRDEAFVPATSLFVDLVRSAAEAGLSVLSSGLPFTIDTRFGAVETATVTLAGATSRASCLGFRRLGQEPPSPLSFSGLACFPRDAAATDRAALACTLDRLDLVSAGDDDALQGVFAAAELARQRGCNIQKVEAIKSSDPTAPSSAATLKRSLSAEAG